MNPMPKSFEDRQALMQLLTSQAPDLLADINTWKAEFPSAKVKYLKLPDGVEYGEQPGDQSKVFRITPEMHLEARTLTVEALEKARKDKLAKQRRSASRRPK